MSDTETKRTIRWPCDAAALRAEDVDFEALAHVLGNTCCWAGRSPRFYSLAQHAVTACGAVMALGGMEEEDRRVLGLHALLADAAGVWFTRVPSAELRPARHGKAAEQVRRDLKAVNEAVLEAAGLDAELPARWAEALRFVQRMTDGAAKRDLPEADVGRRNGSGAGPLFPPLKQRIRPMGPDRAAKKWLERFNELAAPPYGVQGSPSASSIGETNGVADA